MVFYNIDFSATFATGRLEIRMTTMDRTVQQGVLDIFSDGGIEEKIYNDRKVKEEIHYTNIFKKDYGREKERYKEEDSDDDG